MMARKAKRQASPWVADHAFRLDEKARSALAREPYRLGEHDFAWIEGEMTVCNISLAEAGARPETKEIQRLFEAGENKISAVIQWIEKLDDSACDLLDDALPEKLGGHGRRILADLSALLDRIEMARRATENPALGSRGTPQRAILVDRIVDHFGKRNGQEVLARLFPNVAARTLRNWMGGTK